MAQSTSSFLYVYDPPHCTKVIQLEFLMFSPSESESLKVLFLFNKLNVQAVISFCNFLSWECDRWKQNWTWRTPDRRLSKKNRKYREHTHWHTDWWNPGNRGRRERARDERNQTHTHPETWLGKQGTRQTRRQYWPNWGKDTETRQRREQDQITT